MKLANFNTAVINTNYAFDADTKVVVSRKSGKPIKWEDNGKVRLTVNGNRQRFTREEIERDVVVAEPKAERKQGRVTIAAQVRNIMATEVESGITDIATVRRKVTAWCITNTKISRHNAWNYVKNNFDVVLANPSKYKL